MKPFATTRLLEIAEATAAFYRIPLQVLKGRRRHYHIAYPRMVAMYLCRHLADATCEAIGEFFERDHSTVVHAYQTIGTEILTSTDLAAQVAHLERQLDRQHVEAC